MRKELGVVLTIGGAILIWLLKDKFPPGRVHRREIKLMSKKGVCGIEMEPPPVRMRRNEQLHWIIRNPSTSGEPCNRRVEVCVANWRKGEMPAEPPLEEIEGGQFCRTVRQGLSVPLPARVRRDAADGIYFYDVLVDGTVAVDPMVEIVT